MQTTKNTVWPESCRPVTSPLPKCLRVPWAWLSPYMPQQMLVIQLQTRTPACFLRHFDQNVVNWTFRYSWIGRSRRNWAFWFPSVELGPSHCQAMIQNATCWWLLRRPLTSSQRRRQGTQTRLSSSMAIERLTSHAFYWSKVMWSIHTGNNWSGNYRGQRSNS